MSDVAGPPCLRLAPVDVAALVEWITEIPFEAWPQQNRLRTDQVRPAMVTDLGWYDFGRTVTPVIDQLMLYFPGCSVDQRMLSVVMPGCNIPRHRDVQMSTWRARVHVPLVTNPAARIVMADEPFHLEVGSAYLINTQVEHAIFNDGPTPRVHLMFDVHYGRNP